MKSPTLALAFCFALLFASCKQEAVPSYQQSRGFYYWKQRYELNNAERKAIGDLHTTKLYIKVFDVVSSAHGATPVAEIDIDSASIVPGVEYIPTVFITEVALAETPEDQIVSLANRIYTKIGRIFEASHLTLKELQFDCDWTQRTRNKYFHLLHVVKELADKYGLKVSATIRLHQVKYREATGIPPIDRGMLMFYNMSDWRKADTKNSIFDGDEAEKYISYVKDYPLPLDVALPIFRWSIAYRDNAFLAILGGVDRSMLLSPIFAEDGDRFRVLRDTSAFGALLRSGDMIRAEAVDANELTKWSTRIQKLIPPNNRSFVLYHLDSTTLSYYHNEDLHAFFAH